MAFFFLIEHCVILNMGQPGLFVIYFRSFQTNNPIFTTNQYEKCHFHPVYCTGIWTHVPSNMTTRPGLLTKRCVILTMEYFYPLLLQQLWWLTNAHESSPRHQWPINSWPFCLGVFIDIAWHNQVMTKDQPCYTFIYIVWTCTIWWLIEISYSPKGQKEHQPSTEFFFHSLNSFSQFSTFSLVFFFLLWFQKPVICKFEQN